MRIVHRRRGLAAATWMLLMSVSIGAHAPERPTGVVAIFGEQRHDGGQLGQGHTSAGQATSTETRELFVGAFRLVSYVTHDEAGNETVTPYTEGVIMYDASGRMGVHLMDPTHRDRQDGGYIAYFGAYELDVVQGVVRHLIEGSLGGGAGRRTAVRHYRFEDEGKRLILEVRNNGRVVGTVRWERYR